ncbi:hypothetical protein E2542_SST19341 [Spatholobus suberectus]|nr:hypothetical protein E2542_SST19341 [Spatholobus suberectus]
MRVVAPTLSMAVGEGGNTSVAGGLSKGGDYGEMVEREKIIEMVLSKIPSGGGKRWSEGLLGRSWRNLV